MDIGFNTPYSEGIGIENIRLDVGAPAHRCPINILVIHGTLDASKTIIDNYNPISTKKLEQVGFDYVALGHIHKSNANENGKLVYPGSTVSLGFDEQGEHGMIVGQILKEKLHYEFIPLDARTFIEQELDISNINDEQTLIDKLKELENKENKMYKIILAGIHNFEINTKNLLNQNVIKVKDKTKIKYNLEELEKENNLRGLFIKEIKSIEGISEEEAKKAIEIGLEVLI